MGEGLNGQVSMTTGRKNTDEDPFALGVEKLLRFTDTVICLSIAPSPKPLFTFMPGIIGNPYLFGKKYLTNLIRFLLKYLTSKHHNSNLIRCVKSDTATTRIRKLAIGATRTTCHF